MFNFFDEIRKNVKKVSGTIIDNFNIINISGRILYAEGVVSLLKLSKENISFRVKDADIFVEGEEMFLDELSQNTIKIVGKIKKVEQV